LNIINFEPIGFVNVDEVNIPKHYNNSELTGKLVIYEKYLAGLADINAGDCIVVLFHFHKSPNFTDNFLRRIPPHGDKEMGVFSICSPVRPNAIGLSIVKVIEINKNILTVKHLDMLDGTPILDIKPYIKPVFACENI
jgi:tRNA-Thr(GGU) m(6)t(6)A37 methyltransferase TsaA